jgi:TPR repeat protein
MRTLLICLLLTFGEYAYSEYTPEQIAEWRERAEKGEAWRAFNWYRKAAEQGLAQAQFNLGDMYANGNGVKEDKVQSYAWFNIAVGNGHEDAKDKSRNQSESHEDVR